jgi:hypothetical protein
MSESPLLFSSVVPTSEFLLPIAVKNSRSQSIEEWVTRAEGDSPARAARWNEVEGSPTPRLLNLSTAKSGEQSENVYENKG